MIITKKVDLELRRIVKKQTKNLLKDIEIVGWDSTHIFYYCLPEPAEAEQKIGTVEHRYYLYN